MMSDKSQEPWTLPDYQKPLQEGVNTPDTAAKYSAASIAAAVEAKYKTWKFQNSARLVFLGASALALLISQDLVVVGYYIIAYFLVTSLVKTFFLARADRNLTSPKGQERQATRTRNSEVLRTLNEFFESPSATSAFFIESISQGDIDIYSGTTEEAVAAIKAYLRDNTSIGQEKCFNGHSLMCIHRISPDKRAWLTE